MIECRIWPTNEDMIGFSGCRDETKIGSTGKLIEYNGFDMRSELLMERI